MRLVPLAALALLLAGGASAQPSRLLFSPTAHAPEGFSFGTQGLAPSATLGIGPVSVRAGVWMRPDERAAYALPQVTLSERGRLTLGAAAFGAVALAPERRDTHGVGLVLGLATYGTDRQSVTVGLGAGATVESAAWSIDDEAVDALTVLVVGAEAEVVPGVRLMTENVFVGYNREVVWFDALGPGGRRESFVAGPVALSAGTRLSHGPFSLDLAAVVSEGGREPVAVRPWVGLSIDTRPR